MTMTHYVTISLNSTTPLLLPLSSPLPQFNTPICALRLQPEICFLYIFALIVTQKDDGCDSNTAFMLI